MQCGPASDAFGSVPPFMATAWLKLCFIANPLQNRFDHIYLYVRAAWGIHARVWAETVGRAGGAG